ncbi:hypothetical protein [Georgenia sp. SUBG003]|uniref:hypothetical protein n=1 Tax=Georgenia sp. SUBG003 TaxID=1497974 RepID=UPI003AB3906D
MLLVFRKDGRVPNLYYSERANGPVARERSQLPTVAAQGLLQLVSIKLSANWFARTFPEQCYDGNGIVGTDIKAFTAYLRVMVPGAPWPLSDPDQPVSDEVIFDLLEFAHERLAEPQEDSWHEFFRHHELTFNQERGTTYVPLRGQPDAAPKRSDV